MPRVRIYRKWLTDAELKALVDLLEEIGCLVLLEADEEGEPGIAPDESEDTGAEEVLIVLISPDCDSDADLELEALRSAGAGCRIIGLWPKDIRTRKVPKALEKYGSDVVTWDPEKLRQSLQGSQAQWETPAGTPRAAPITKRNRC